MAVKNIADALKKKETCHLIVIRSTVVPSTTEQVIIPLLEASVWDEFNTLNYEGKIIIDGRRIEKAREARIYEGIC